MVSSRKVGMAAMLSIGVVALVGCGGDDTDDASATGDEVAGGAWVLVELDGAPVPDGVAVTLDYDGGRIAGSSGCNTYGGAAQFEDGSVTISSEIMSTLMACPPPADEVERAFLGILPTVTRFEVDDSTLTLRADDEPALVFVDESAGN